MELLTEGIAAAAVCLAVMTLIWAVRGKILAPRKCRAKLFTVVEFHGGEEVEQLCRWLGWLRSGGADMEILLLTDGLSLEDEQRARLITDSMGGKAVSRSELTQMIGERLWQEKRIT